MINITKLQKKLSHFISEVKREPSLSSLVIGAFNPSSLNARLAASLHSVLSSTFNLEKNRELGGHLITTTLFVQDIEKVMSNDDQLLDIISLWQPVLSQLLNKVGEQDIAPLRALSFTAAKHYKEREDELLWQWFTQVVEIKKEFSVVLENAQREKMAAIENEKLTMRTQGVAAPDKATLRPATAGEWDIVKKQYNFGPASNYDIKNVEVIDHPLLLQQYNMTKYRLQKRSSKPVFFPKPHWKGYDLEERYTIPPNADIQPESLYLYLKGTSVYIKFINSCGVIEEQELKTLLDKSLIEHGLRIGERLSSDQVDAIFKSALKYGCIRKNLWRETSYQFFTEMSFTEPDSPDVKQSFQWHGTHALQGILETGYASLAITDPGFFSKGIYGTTSAEYAYRVYAKGGTGALILNKMCGAAVYPVIPTDKLFGTPHYGNYDAHFILVYPKGSTPNEVNYRACKPDELPTYTEMVIFDPTACYPCYKVELQPILPKSIHPPPRVEPLSAQQAYSAGEFCVATGKPLVAFYYFLKAKKLGEPKADTEIKQLLLTSPVLTGKFVI